MTTTLHPWLGHYPKDIDWQEEIVPRALPVMLEETAAKYPRRIAVEFLGRRVGYQDLLIQAQTLASALQKKGISKGDRVGIMLPNCPAYIISYYGILMAGGTVVNINPLYAEAELIHQIEDAGIDILITANLQLIFPKVEVALQQTDLKKLIIVDFARELPPVKGWLYRIVKMKDLAATSHCKPCSSFHTLIRTIAKPEPVTIEPEKDIAVLQYTGGTTGVAKGAVLTHANLYINAVQCERWCKSAFSDHEKVMGVLPLFHVFAMTAIMNLGILRGFELVLLPRFDLVQLLKMVTRIRPTLMPGVPTMFNAINQHDNLSEYDLSSLACCISGGAGLPLEVKQRFEELTGCTVIEGYGLTETSPVAAANPLIGDNRAGSIGLPFPQTHISIRNPDEPAEEMPVGEVGEICIAGPQVMQGYWNRPEEQAHVFTPDGYLRTGDLGKMDADGYSYVVDRLKEMIISHGYNIYPRHVEEALYEHDAVAEAAVIGVPDETYGQKVKACVVLKSGFKPSEQDIRLFLEKKLARYAIPREIDFRAELPKSMIGKILKKELLAEELDRAKQADKKS